MEVRSFNDISSNNAMYNIVFNQSLKLTRDLCL